MEFNFEKLCYYFGGVGFVLLLGILWYIFRGKKDAEEALKKKLEEEAAAQASGGGAGLYTLCPNNNEAGDVPDILISDPSGVVESKINSVIPREIYKNYPKTEEERINHRRDFVINMIVSEGASTEDYTL